jgi:MFS superfamily sulfate permease-like transporter
LKLKFDGNCIARNDKYRLTPLIMLEKSETKKSKLPILYIIFILIFIVFVIYDTTLGLIIGLVMLVVVLIQTYQRQRLITLTSKFGDLNAKLIIENKIKIGMSKEMVQEAWGKGNDKKEINDKTGSSETFYYKKNEDKNSKKKFLRYAKFLNNELTEFGDV